MEEKYYQLLNEKNEAERLLAERQSKPLGADYTELVYRVVDAKSNFEKYCVEVLEALMKQNANMQYLCEVIEKASYYQMEKHL